MNRAVPFSKRQSRSGLPFLSFAVVLLALAGIFQGSQFGGALAGFSAASFLGSIAIWSRALLPNLYTIPIFIWFQIVPAFFLGVTMLLVDKQSAEMHPFGVVNASAIWTMFALVAPSLGFLLCACVVRVMLGQSPHPVTLRELTMRVPKGFEGVLIFTAIIQFSPWITTDPNYVDTWWAWGLRILTRSIGLTSFLAGYLAYRFKRSTAAWVIGFTVSIGLAILTGSRGYAYLPMIPFLFGLALSEEARRNRARHLMILAPVAIFAFAIAGWIEQLRGGGARMNVSDIRAGGIAGVISRVSSSSAVDQSRSFSGLTTLQTAAARMVNWPNVVVPLMTPSEVPYRGADDLGSEIRSFFSLGKIADDQGIYWSNMVANNYGFLVNEATSVEFGIAADGASRFGWSGAVFYGFVCALFVIILEKICLFTRWRLPSTYAISIFSLAGVAAFGFVTTGIFSSLRSAMLGVAAVVIVYAFFEIITQARQTRF